VAHAANAQDLPRGVVIDDVTCAGDASQSYALYLPSTYSPGRRWSVLVGFHPGARGRAIVETYRAAAEQYGYIVVGSNNSRNGPWDVSAAAIKAIFPDVDARFPIDSQRIYLTGHSGGARVAMQVALANKAIAGVIASSAGFPDSQPRSKVGFAVFGTAGIDDFNYIELRMLDRKLTSPHRLAIFAGGHTLPPADVALEAIEWMELQAMKSGRRPRDEAFVDALLGKRRAAIDAATGTRTVHLLEAVVDDFKGLRDVSAEEQRAKDLAKDGDIRKALARERAFDDEESRMIGELAALEAALADGERRAQSLLSLRDRLAQLSQKATAAEESPERSRARRVLRALSSGVSARTSDREYLELIEKFGMRGREPTPR
jgi:pimeloyl-ACP methyl ester carboxylesterase